MIAEINIEVENINRLLEPIKIIKYTLYSSQMHHLKLKIWNTIHNRIYD